MHKNSVRLRRNRLHGWVRRLTKENSIAAQQLVLPVFVHLTKETIYQLDPFCVVSSNRLLAIAQEAENLGISALLLFPVLPERSPNDNAEVLSSLCMPICAVIKQLRGTLPDIGILIDLALDPYTKHGHDGILSNGRIDNDGTVNILCHHALQFAQAGVDMVAPSDMMDCHVAKIREVLDLHGFHEIGIMSYGAKFASSLYKPFRRALNISDTMNLMINKESYQIPPSNSKEAIREIEQDIAEGADSIIVKPAALYLDIIKETASHFNIPILGYMVSGEYLMIRKMEENNPLFSRHSIMREAIIGIKRAGASAIITYNALDIARDMQINGEQW